MKNLLLTLMTLISMSAYSEVDHSNVKEEIIENTVDLSTEVIQLNQNAIRDIASDDQEIDRLNSNDVQFWFLDQNE